MPLCVVETGGLVVPVSGLDWRSGSILHDLFGDDPSHTLRTSLGSTSKSYPAANGATTTLLVKAWGECAWKYDDELE